MAISLAILGFACVSLLGMIPVGLTSFHQAMGNTVEAQIVQDLSNDILLANFSDLNQYAQSYYYNSEGTLLSQGSLPSTGTVVYTATVTLPTSAGTGGAVGFGNAVALNNPSNSTSAYSVTITITNISNPAQPHSYSVIIPNNNQ